MKTFFLIVSFLVSGLCGAQVTERILIDGKVTVPIGEDAFGINVFNLSSNKGTVTQNDGTFRIEVGLGDEVSFSALQYQDFTVVIDQIILDAGKLHVFINEGVTELPEVIVGAPDLSGNVEVDVRRIAVAEANLPDVSAADIEIYEWEFRPDEQTSPRNAALESSTMVNGLNFANLFRGIYSSRIFGSEDFDSVEEDVRALYDDAFFREELNIKEENIYNFILFAEENGLNEEMLEEGNELDLLEFLIVQSRKFKRQNQD